eukprot:COSAG01_NODE_3637_length_5841_cov_105.166493_2_plen_95_part_00
MRRQSPKMPYQISTCLNTEIVLPIRDLQFRRSADGLQFRRSKDPEETLLPATVQLYSYYEFLVLYEGFLQLSALPKYAKRTPITITLGLIVGYT